MSSSKPNLWWQEKTLDEITEEEWESLCDGCGKCCLHKLEDEDSGDVYYTDIACAYLDEHSCSCKDYSHRLQNVPDCLQLQPKDVEQFFWLPSTCAYRLLAEGKPLEEWHPLVSGDTESVHQYHISVRGRVVLESQIDPDEYEERVIHWVT